LRFSRRRRPPFLVKKTGSSSRELCANFRVRGRSGPAQLFRRTSSTSRGISSPIATSATRIHLDGELPTTHLSSVLSVPPALDGLLPAKPIGLISSRSHVWGSPSKGCSLLPSRYFSSKHRALMTFPDPRLSKAEADDANSSHRASKALIQAAIRDH
jgi:hypothetical protein